MISVFAHHDISHEGFGRQSAFDQSGGSRRFNDAGGLVRSRLFAASARVFRAPRDDHAHLGLDLVQALRRILADDVQRAAAARADLALRLDHLLLMRQTVKALAAAGAALLRALGLEHRFGFLVLRLSLGERGLKLFEGDRKLVIGDTLGFAAEGLS